MEAFLVSIMAWSWLVYLGIFAVLFIETLGAPMPGLSAALVGAAFAGQGRLEIWWVALATIAGGSLGGLCGYLLGRRGGRRLLEQHGRYVLITPQRLAQGERLFEKHGNKAVLFSRYLPVLCFLVGPLAGVVRQAPRKFALFNMLSMCLWSVTHLTLAFIFGRSLDVLVSTINNIGLLAVLAVALVVGGGYLWKIRRKRTDLAGLVTPKIQAPVVLKTDQEH